MVTVMIQCMGSVREKHYITEEPYDGELSRTVLIEQREVTFSA